MIDVPALLTAIALVGLSSLALSLRIRVERAEERLADLRLRMFALVELMRDKADQDIGLAGHDLEALFPEVMRFEPITPDELRAPESLTDLWPDTLKLNTKTGAISPLGRDQDGAV